MSKPRGDGYVFVFATVICLTCSVLLAVSESVLKPFKEKNVANDKRFNVLKALGVEVLTADGGRIAPEKVDELYAASVREMVLDGATGQPLDGVIPGKLDPEEISSRRKLPLYIRNDDSGNPQKYAFPVSGKGLWSTIYGYLALDKDLATIAGATFYKHGETPGLGGEVEADWFQKNFAGKKAFKDGARTKFTVVKGTVADKFPNGNDHAVDGISGATITGDGVAKFINSDLDRYETYFRNIRGK